MIILGIDPGTAMTGVGVIKCTKKEVKNLYFNSIKTKNDRDSADRLNFIHQEVLNILKSINPKL